MLKVLKYIFRILAWTIETILVILVLACLLIQTKPFKRRLATFAGQQASSFVNGRVSIGEISGNFFTNLRLKNVLLSQDNDTVAFISSIDTRYNLLPLLRRKVQLHLVGIDRPLFNMKQINDSTWNFQQIVKSGQENDTTESSGEFRFEVSLLELNNGVLNISSTDSVLPRRTDHINTRLSLKWEKNQQQLQLHRFSLSARHPDLELENISFLFKRNAHITELKDFDLKTKKNTLQGNAEYALKKEEKSTVAFQSGPLQLNEFGFLVPGLNFRVAPVLKIDATVQNDSLSGSVNLSDNGQQMQVDIMLPNFSSIFGNKENTGLKYDLNGNFTNVNLAHWLGNPEFRYIINGAVTARGTGITPETAVTNLRGNFNNSLIMGKPLGRLAIDLRLNRGNLNGRINGAGLFGSFVLTPAINNITGNRPAYRLSLVTRQLNLARITGNDSLRSDINIRANINGQGFNHEALSARGEIYVIESSLRQIKVDTIFADLQYRNKNILIDSLLLKTGNFSLDAHGNYSINSTSDVWINASFDGLDEFTAFLPLDSVSTSGALHGYLHKTTDSLQVKASVNLNETAYNDILLRELTVNATGLFSPTDTIVKADFVAKGLQQKSLMLDSVFVNARAKPDSVFLEAGVDGKNLNSRIKAGILPGKKTKVILSEWDVNYENHNWKLQDAPAIIEMDSTNFHIADFKLAADADIPDSLQYIKAHGTISREGEENFFLNIANLDIGKLAGTFYPQFKGSGLFNLNMNLTGTSDNPVLKSNFKFDRAVLANFKITDFAGSANYSDGKLDTEAHIVPLDKGKIAMTGQIPVRLRLDSISFNYNPEDHTNALLTVEQFPLTILKSIVPADEITGNLNGQITVNGTIKEPNPTGHLKLNGGSVKIAEYGIDYRTIDLDMKFLAEQIHLDTFLIRTADGTLSAHGLADFNSVFYRGDINKSDIAVQLRRFNPVNHRQFNMQVSGNAGLTGEKGAVKFSGDLTIPQSDVSLPAVMAVLGRVSPNALPEPILLQEMQRMAASSDTVPGKKTTEKQQAEVNDTLPGYFDRFTGRLNIRIPRNSWIRNDDMYVEISGDLALIKNSDFFEIFGTIDIMRGQYSLFGRTFILSEGTVSLQGGQEINPTMNITASYSFRNPQNIRQKLTVTATGTMKAPTVAFKLDDETINEGDALSYILFGRSMSELSIDQQSNMSGSGGGNLATSAVASVLSAQLTNYLGNMLNFDYLEIKSEGGFENATIVVGKYITNNLFVSYEQRIGEQNRQANMTTYEVRLEFQIFRFLFLQLNNSSIDSGFDVIYKYDSQRRQ